MVTIGFDIEAVRPFVRAVEEAARIDCPYCMPYERRPILVTRGLTIERTTLWERLKRYL